MLAESVSQDEICLAGLAVYLKSSRAMKVRCFYWAIFTPRFQQHLTSAGMLRAHSDTSMPGLVPDV